MTLLLLRQANKQSPHEMKVNILKKQKKEMISIDKY